MADSQETRVLKDINRHLASIDTGKGLSDSLSPSETAALNKNVQEIMGNFSSLIDTQLKETLKVTNRAFSEAFGKLEGLNADEQVGLLDDVVDELEMNNRFMAKAEHNNFLAEAERETDLNINRRTNDLLEDILENEEDASASASAEANATKGFLSGGMGGLFGGLFAGKSIKGLMGGIKGIGKKVFFPLLITGAAIEFLRGWEEAGEDASTIDKFNSGIGRMASDLTFGLVSKKFFTNALESIEKAIGDVWSSFTTNWEEFVTGKITGPDFFANIISDLSMGTLSPEQLKKIGTQIKDGMTDLVSTVVNAMIEGFIDPVFDQLAKDMVEILDDPIAFAKKKMAEARANKKKADEDLKALAKKIQKDENISEAAAAKQAGILNFVDQYLGPFSGIAAKIGLGVAKKRGAFSETPAEADVRLAKKQAEIEAKQQRAETRKLRQADAKRKRLAFRTIPAPVSDIGSEGIKEKIEAARMLTESQKIQEGSGNAVQINNATTVSTPVDRSTENDDALNLQRGD